MKRLIDSSGLNLQVRNSFGAWAIEVVAISKAVDKGEVENQVVLARGSVLVWSCECIDNHSLKKIIILYNKRPIYKGYIQKSLLITRKGADYIVLQHLVLALNLL